MKCALLRTLKPLSKSESENGVFAYKIGVKEIKDVPILESIFYEALRHYTNGAGIAIIVEESMLDDLYFLKDSCLYAQSIVSFQPRRLGAHSPRLRRSSLHGYQNPRWCVSAIWRWSQPLFWVLFRHEWDSG